MHGGCAKMLWTKNGLCKNAFDALQKCIFAQHFGVHFPLENVQQGNCYVFCLAKNKALHLVVYKNVFVTFDVQKCIFARQTWCKKCIFAYIFPWKMFSITFCKAKCSAKIYFCIFLFNVFCKAKKKGASTHIF